MPTDCPSDERYDLSSKKIIFSDEVYSFACCSYEKADLRGSAFVGAVVGEGAEVCRRLLRR